ncbi:MAG: NAD(P)H-dependent oxidoreductase [Pseudomonas sp.]|nr:NAD(P)H-dependent oxidoreductase [Pseudomonas sp.]
MIVKVLAFCGSTRQGSLNQKLLDVAARGAQEAGAQVTFVSLRDYPLPLYDGDLEKEQGVPAHAHALQELFRKHDAVLLASPEHNGGYTALLKNAIDWVSRPTSTGHSGVTLFANKAAAVISASPGPMGGIRGVLATRMVLEKLGAIVIPQSFTLGVAHLAFDEDARCSDANVDREVGAVGAALVKMAVRLTEGQ